MAHFVEQYSHAIKQCEDFDSLATEINICISNNVLNHVSMDIKTAIDTIDINTSFTKFVKSMVWASSVSDHTETSLNLLRHFCNRVTKEIDALITPIDDFSLMILVICADDKQFINKFTDEQKLVIIRTICRWYLVFTKDDKNSPNLEFYLLKSVNEILRGKISLEELDREFQYIYGDTKRADIGTAKAHPVNEILRPFQALFINIMQNQDQSGLLNQICFDEWRNRIDGLVEDRACRYAKKFNKATVDDYRVFIANGVWFFKDFNDSISSTGYENIVNPVVGAFIWRFLDALHQSYTEHDFSANEIAMLVREAKFIFYSCFAVNDSARTIIDCVVGSYCDTGDYEDAFFKGDYYLAIKSYLNQDELFRVWYDSCEDKNRMGNFDRVLATYIHCYMNPELERANELIRGEENPYINRPIAPKKDLDPVTEAENNKTNMDDDEPYAVGEDENETEEEYDGPEIDAKQSTKGYKKFSKFQSDSERKIYKAYKKYKNNEEKVDSQLSKMITAAKRAFSQDKTEEIIEGKRFTPIGILKKVLNTAAIFSFSKIGGIVYLVVSHTLSKKRTIKQKHEILSQIEAEIKMLDEKIEDARSDGNRKAKYALMRTRGELVRARDKIRYNLSASKKDMDTARSYIYNDKQSDDSDQ